jgi:hypothetical protein
MGSQVRLAELLAELFDQRGLRRFLHAGPDGDRVVDALRFDEPLDEVAYQAAGLLRSWGLVDPGFFARLRAARGLRSADIDVVAAEWPGPANGGVATATHVIVLVAAIAGQVSAIDEGQIRAALGACREGERLDLDLHDLAAGAGRAATWSEGQARIRTGVQEFLRTAVLASPVRRVAVFGLAPIPWLMALGHALSETVEATVHQRLRAPSTWTWQPHAPELGGWHTRVVASDAGARDVAVLVSASARVSPARVDQTLAPVRRATYELALDAPALDAVRSAEQLAAFARAYRDLLGRIEQEQPQVERLHVFAAAPVAVAIECGRTLLHSADPPLVVYHFHERRYVRALELRG